jgi:hypothetical protein
VQFIADPRRLAFDAIAGLRIVGRADEQSRGLGIGILAPTHGLPRPRRIILLPADVAQQLHGWDLPQPARRRWGIHRREEMTAIGRDGRSERCPVGFLGGPAGLAEARTVTVKPLGRHLGPEPGEGGTHDRPMGIAKMDARNVNKCS